MSPSQPETCAPRMFWGSLQSAQVQNTASCHYLCWRAAGGSIGHGLSGANGERENSMFYWNLLIVDLNNCLKSSAYILRIQVLGFVAVHPCNASVRLQGESHASFLSTEPMSCTLTFTWGRGGLEWMDIQYCKEPYLCSSRCLRKSLSHREGNLFMMEYHSLICERGYGWLVWDLTIVSDSWLPWIFCKPDSPSPPQNPTHYIIFIQYKVSWLEFHTSSSVFPWRLRMWHKSSAWFPGGPS